jgi:hypothetical protein
LFYSALACPLPEKPEISRGFNLSRQMEMDPGAVLFCRERLCDDRAPHLRFFQSQTTTIRSLWINQRFMQKIKECSRFGLFNCSFLGKSESMKESDRRRTSTKKSLVEDRFAFAPDRLGLRVVKQQPWRAVKALIRCLPPRSRDLVL